MPIVSVRDNKNSRWKRNAKSNKSKTTTPKKKKEKEKEKKQGQKTASGNRSYSKKVRAKWFWCKFKLGFLQLICNASLSRI